jgi:hypothetical protein
VFQNATIISTGTSEGYFVDKAKRGEKDYVVSSSMLREFKRCQLRWKNGYVSPESTAKEFGSQVDCLLMTPKDFPNRFPVHPDTYKNDKGIIKKWNATATACKEWLESCEEGQVPMGQSDFDEIQLAVQRMKDDETVNAWIASSVFQVWIQATWVDEKTGLEIPCKALIDFVPDKDGIYRTCLGDLKCIRNASVSAFAKQVYQLGWHFQAAFYLDLYVAATGEDRVSYCFVGVENFAPFQPFRRLLGTSFVEIGRRSYVQAMTDYARSLHTGIWKGYDDTRDAEQYQGFSLVEPFPYMSFESDSEEMEFAHEAAREEITNENEPPMP